ncbi:hypothetical protein AB0J52_00080 [Spirillospora sp. NPDC049652]
MRMGETGSDEQVRVRRRARRRRYQRGVDRRTCRIPVWVSEQERAALAAAAERSGWALGAFVAETALSVVEEREPPECEPWREVVTGLMQASGQVNRVGVNLNQAVAALHASGAPTAALEGYARTAERVLLGLDEAVQEARRKLR